MKTKIFALMACMVLVAGTVFANPTKKKATSQVATQIEKCIGYPAFANENNLEGVVNLVVKLNDANELEISKIWGSDEGLVNYVEKKVTKMAMKHGAFDGSKESKLIRVTFSLIN
jgi:hypothetical protein